MDPITIRDATLADLDGLLAARYADSPAIHRDRIADAISDSLQYLVITQDGEILGFGLLVHTRPPHWPVENPEPPYPQMIDLFVTPSRRSEGLGTMMIRHMERLASAAGYARLCLAVDPIDNPDAQRLYARLGYVPIEPEPHRSTWRFVDSEGHTHQGSKWSLAMAKALA